LANISAAILCDFAQVRENLLFVSSGGLTRIFAPKVPAPFNMMLGLIFEIGPDEVAAAHEFTVVIKHIETAKDVARIVGGFQVDGQPFPGEGLYAPMALDFRTVSVPEFGALDVHTEIDGNVGPQLTCYVIEVPAIL
jgi:hypothetical protein